MKKVNLVEFSDLLFYAEKIGYTWNQAHDILVKDEVPPMYETKTKEFEIEYLEEHDIKLDSDSYKIIKGFMESKKITKMTLVN